MQNSAHVALNADNAHVAVYAYNAHAALYAKNAQVALYAYNAQVAVVLNAKIQSRFGIQAKEHLPRTGVMHAAVSVVESSMLR